MVEGTLALLIFAWFGLHVSFPRTSQVSRVAGVLLAATFLEFLVYFALHGGLAL